MTNLHLEFLNSPWWLLLLIPAFFLALFPHFRVAKKYRRNRNRIISLVLHLVVMTFCIIALSGLYFTYDLVNTNNEVLILVDMSYSSETFSDRQYDKDDFVRTVIEESDSNYKIGVVTFGYNQVYAAEMSTDIDAVYRNYLNAELPDDSASDLASALDYARSLFSDQSNGKVVLVSDGAETDGDALTAIRMLVANGIQVNTAYIPDDFSGNNEVLISGIELPDYNVTLDEAFEVSVMVRARNLGLGAAKVTLYDETSAEDEQQIAESEADIVAGEQKFTFNVTLTNTGMHKLRFSVSGASDDVKFNNDYYSYIYIESINNILVLEKETNESDNFVKTLGEEYTAKVINIGDTDNLPTTLDALREYDEIILMNVANRDMPEGFIDMLYTYVHDIGGGLFTVGGTREDEYGNTVPNLYDRNDMYDVSEDGVMVPTLYQEMLPVQSINYTPPIGVMIIIDRSGSMGTKLSGDETRLDVAKRGAEAAVYALSERDYCGIMTLDTEFQVEQSLIPATQQARLLRIISEIEMGGGTMYAGAIQRAGEALLSLRNVERRHIILVSDGEPGDKTFDDYGSVIKANYAAGITFSMVAIDIDQNSPQDEDMERAAKAGHGRYYRVWDDTLADKMSQELKLPEITEISTEPFQPRIRDHTAAVAGVDQADIPMLGGYFGTKIKEDALIPLAGEFVPILAHWRYGEGRVGSFMCDLTGTGWSQEFMKSASGVKILNQTVKTLLPTVDIRSTGITVEFTEDNYSTNASIFTDMEEGDRIELSVYSVPAGAEEEQLLQKIAPTKEQGYSNITFKITEAGVYKVVVSRLDAAGKLLAEDVSYRTFSYSEEYNVFIEESECKEFIERMATVGKGKVIPLDEPWTVFEEDIEALHHKFDPRWLLLISSIVLFLLDIAVRKFKFKWIHEIIRDRRENAQSEAEMQGGSPTEKV